MRIGARTLPTTHLSALVVVLTLSGCAADDPFLRTKAGAGVGAAAGGVIGAVVGDGKGALVGAALGALAGGAVGNYMDTQQRDFEQALAEEQRSNALEIERLQDETLKLSLDSEVSFDVGRAEVKPAFQPTLDKLANVINKYNRTVVHVVGHTDSDGSDAYNLELSDRRASAVRSYLLSGGVAGSRVLAEGRGEREPRAANTSAAGKQLNRRVEIYVKPIVEGQEQRAYEPPTLSG
ncbi:MAG: OmpA family protein [Gammaproteobacteria bacterium]|nr:OmpA family protein [Gammaproteobacteria bacterium]